MASHSLSSLILRVRRMADVVNNTTATTSAEVQQYLWNSLYELQQNVGALSTGDRWLAVTATALTTAGTGTYPVNGQTAYGAEAYAIRGVDVLLGTDWQPIGPIGWSERDKYTEDPSYPYRNPQTQYKIFSRPNISGSTLSVFSTRILFVPTPATAFRYRIWYVPSPDMSTVTNFARVPPLWDEYAVLDASMKVLERDEQDVSQLAARKAQLRDTILRTAQDMDLGFPERVQDTNRFFEP